MALRRRTRSWFMAFDFLDFGRIPRTLGRIPGTPDVTHVVPGPPYAEADGPTTFHGVEQFREVDGPSVSCLELCIGFWG